jgi:26S proteasome regulatory subunit N8
MFRKVNARERVLGWYSTGPRLREADLDINDLFSRYVDSPILVICEVQPKEMGLPTTAYYTKEQVREDGTQKSQKVFVNLPTEVGATEAEEIGVEHLLRDVKDSTVSTLSTEVASMVIGMRGLKSRLQEIQQYLSLVVEGKLPVNHDIMYQLQDVFNLLPNLNVQQLTRSFAVKTNDMMLVVYLSSMIRSVLALHNLIENKEHRMHSEKQESKQESDKANKAKGSDTGKTAENGKAPRMARRRASQMRTWTLTVAITARAAVSHRLTARRAERCKGSEKQTVTCRAKHSCP